MGAVLLGVSSMAQAFTIYKFDSANYTSASGIYTTSMHLEFTIGLPNALPPGATTTNVSQLPGFTLEWSDGVSTFSVGNQVGTLNLTTDVTGAVTGWDYNFFDSSFDHGAAGNNIFGPGFVQVVDFTTTPTSTAGRPDGIGTWTITEVPTDDPDHDGVPNDADACPNSDLSATVIIDGCDSRAQNDLLTDGCTISDLVTNCLEESSTRLRALLCVTRLTKDLRKAGDIRVQESIRILSCTVKSLFP